VQGHPKYADDIPETRLSVFHVKIQCIRNELFSKPIGVRLVPILFKRLDNLQLASLAWAHGSMSKSNSWLAPGKSTAHFEKPAPRNKANILSLNPDDIKSAISSAMKKDVKDATRNRVQ